ncbi:MAG: hypothetical protein A2Y62_01585 [Candidatus Fischerbacteria bacterium RBG_13_37_8]|uniref:Uncharacterized protein n=1 Tax=Candidatus Fischerbacteria bacterium RBG_13_37_8 TaxID=1817863 RepID=A0A1F5VTW8_9BACT|nr:MAG: hypothetical protein A2Y62_01585 [Candidatus Fischerbacteria bacterium RBG_13_37_8]
MNAQTHKWIYLAFLAPALIYLYQLCPTVYVHDSGELITASYVLGIPHPAGSPFYCMVGKLFQLITPAGNIAFRMNAMSALFAVLAAMMLYILMYKITNEKSISLAVAFTFAFSGMFWSQALVAEVYTMSTFIFLLALICFSNYFQTGERKQLYYFGLFCGLLLTIHMEYSLLCPFVWIALFLFIWKKDSFKTAFMTLLKTTLCFFAGLLPYTYLPIRSRANPVIDWGNTETLTNLFYHITAKNVQKRMFTLGFEDYLDRFYDYMMIIFHDTLFIGIAGIIALILGFKKQRYIQLLLLCLLLVDAFFIIFLDEVPIQSEAYGIPSVLAVCIGLSQMPLIFKQETRKRFAPLLFIIPVLFIVFHFKDSNRNNNFIPYDYNLNMLYQPPENSVLFTREDNRTFVMLYLQTVEGRRQDLALYDTSNHIFHNPYKELFFLLPASEVTRIRENVESDIIKKASDSGRYVFYTDPDTPYETASFKIQPCGLIGLAVKPDASFADYQFCRNDWTIRGEDDPKVKKDWMTNAILAMNYYNDAQYKWFKDEKSALASMEKASSEKGQYAELHFMMGRSYLHHNYADRALEEFETAVKVNRRLWQAYVQSAFILGKTGRYEQAIQKAERALAIDENSADAYEFLALASFKIGNHDEAEKHFLRAAELEPDNVTFNYNIINFYVQTKRISEAERFLKSYLEKVPQDEKFAVLLANLYRNQGKWSDLLTISLKLTQKSPSNSNYYYLLAEAYIQTGNYDMAQITVNKILELNPEDEIGHQLMVILERMR